MSRVGKKSIIIEPGITVSMDLGKIHINGPKGELVVIIPEGLKVGVNNNQIEVSAINSEKTNLQGLVRSLINNAVIGVKTGWTKTLEMVGVGFRAQTEGNELILNLGYSHPVKIVAPKNISFSVKENKIIVSGMDKYEVGEIAANIRRAKPPEPYKGKGIRYLNEYIRKKLGKAAKAVGGATK